MAARFWQWVLACDLAIAVAGAALIARGRSLHAAMVVVIAVGILICIHALSLAGSFIASFAFGQAAGRRAHAGRAVRAFLIEFVLFGKAMIAMSAAPWRRSVGIDRPTAGRMRPVLLIHGFLCNGAIWRPWLGPLRAAGFAPVRAVDLEPLFGDIDGYAAQVARELRELQGVCGGARVAIVGHSLGGVVARAALRSVGPAVVSEIVTIASPHHGLAMARLYPLPPLKQLSPESPWLRALEAAEIPRSVPCTCLYSREDNLIVPARSAVIDGARIHEFEGLGHVSLIAWRRTIDCALAALSCG